ncbi:MAG: hypothetical protein N3A68_06445 [Bacteroidia bacterium]|nr:hypothetical protein [Bacteroidia bacterium]GIV23014.1 MAG: hypothetical protein KatS3mg025_0673 [Bacteroidia bacterium]
MKRLAYLLGTVILGGVVLLGCKKDPCKDVTCQNGGTCNDGKCTCSLPWEGSKCEVDAREKFVGSWSGTENCGGSVDNVAFSINKSQVEAIAIVIDNQIRGKLTSSTTFEVPSQQVTSGGQAVTISGSGNLNGNTLTLTLTYTVGGTAVTCTYTMNRQ